MKKILLFLLAFCISFVMAGCDKFQSTLSVAGQYKLAAQNLIDNGDIETAIKALKEGIAVTGNADLEAMVKELESKKQGGNVNTEASTETALPIQTTDLLPSFSSEERRSLNIFLSNFSEAYFSSYNQASYTNSQLIGFAFTHNNINNSTKIKYAGSEMGISFQDVNTTLERYFGKNVPAQSTESWIYRDGFFYTPAATGETYAYFSIAANVFENPDGTLDVSFSVFFDESNAFEVALQEWYSYSMEQAESLCTKRESGIAKIRHKTYNGKAAYELISYTLQQEKPVRESITEAASKKDDFLNQARSIEQYEETYLSTAATTADLNNQSGIVYEKWDNLLNDVYQYLKIIMPGTEFSRLQSEEITWITEKERAIESAATQFGNGTGATLERNSTAIQYTKERCYYLINLIQ